MIFFWARELCSLHFSIIFFSVWCRCVGWKVVWIVLLIFSILEATEIDMYMVHASDFIIHYCMLYTTVSIWIFFFSSTLFFFRWLCLWTGDDALRTFHVLYFHLKCLQFCWNAFYGFNFILFLSFAFIHAPRPNILFMCISFDLISGNCIWIKCCVSVPCPCPCACAFNKTDLFLFRF